MSQYNGLYNRAQGTYELHLPPRHNKKYKPSDDVYIREKVPTFNFGNRNNIIVGNKNNDIHRGLIKFDVSDIDNTFIVENAKMTLTFEKTNIDFKNLEISSLKQEFYEYGITWASNPEIKNNIKIIECLYNNTSKIEIDLTEIVQDWVRYPEMNYGMMLKSLDETLQQFLFIYSKEHSFSPTLDVRYFNLLDKSMFMKKRDNIEADLIVKQTVSADMLCSIELVSKYKKEDLECELTINNPSCMEANLIVTQDSLQSEIKVRQHTDLTASLRIVEHMINDLNSNMFISQPRLYSNLIVKRTEVKDISGSLIVKQKLSEDINGEILISRPILIGKAKIRSIETLNSELTVSRKVDFDLESNMFVSQPRMFSHMFIKYRNDLESNLVVKTGETIDLDARMTVCRPNMESSINVRQYDSLIADMFVVYKVENDLKSNMTVKVKREKDLNSVIKIRATETLQGELYVNSPIMSGQLIVRTKEENDINSEVSIRATETLIANVNVRKPIDLEASLTIKQLWFEDLVSLIKVKQTLNQDLKSSLIVKNPNLKCDMIVKGKVNNDLEVEIFIRRSKNSNYIFIM